MTNLWIFEPNPEYRNEAACRGEPIEWFYPLDGNYTKARTVCVRCPVQLECRSDAVINAEWKWSFWGGMTGPERYRWSRRATLVLRCMDCGRLMAPIRRQASRPKFCDVCRYQRYLAKHAKHNRRRGESA